MVDVLFRDEDVAHKDEDVTFDHELLTLTVADSYSSCVADSIIIEYAFLISHGLNLQYAGAVVLFQQNIPTVSNTSHANIAGEITLSIPETVSDVDTSWLDGESYKFQDDVAAEFYPHDVATLVLSDGTQANVTESVVLFTQTILTISSPYDKQITDSVTLSEEVSGVSFVVNSSVVVNVAATVTLSQWYPLAASNTYHVIAAESVDLVADDTLTLSDGTQLNVAQTVAFIVEGIDDIVPESATQYQYAGAVALVQEYELAVSASVIVNASDTIGIADSGSLIVSNAYSGQTAGSVILSQRNEIVLTNSVNLQTAGAVVLLQSYNVNPAASYVVQVAETTLLGVESEDTLTVAASVHVQVADSFTLVLRYIITVDDSIQVNNSEALTYLATYQDLSVSDSINNSFAQSVVLGFRDGFLGVIVDPYLISITHQRAMDSLTQHRYLMQ